MAAPTQIRRINRHEVLAELLRSGVATRSSLARATGLSQPTTGKIVDELLAERLLQPTAEPSPLSGRMGRPGHALTINSTRPVFLGIQLGPVRTRLAALPVAPPADDQWDETFATPSSPAQWLRHLKSSAAPITSSSMKAVLVSVPGVLDEATGRSILSPNLRWLEGEHIASRVEQTVGLPAIAIQEIRCLALGHQAIDRACGSFLLVDFGIGVGAAPVVHGQPMQGQPPMSGELGHTPVAGNHLPCGCGGTGCLETLVGRDHLLGTLKIRPNAQPADWQRVLNGLTAGRMPTRFRHALDAAALGIAGALNVLGLDQVILTGFLSELPSDVLDVMRDRIRTAALAGRLGTVRMTVARRHRLAGLVQVGIDRVIAPR